MTGEIADSEQVYRYADEVSKLEHDLLALALKVQKTNDIQGYLLKCVRSGKYLQTFNADFDGTSAVSVQGTISKEAAAVFLIVPTRLDGGMHELE